MAAVRSLRAAKVVQRGRAANASERRWFESVDFGASALEEEEDYRLVAKANELMVVDSSPPYPLNGSAGPCLAPNMLRGQLVVPP